MGCHVAKFPLSSAGLRLCTKHKLYTRFLLRRAIYTNYIIMDNVYRLSSQLSALHSCHCKRRVWMGLCCYYATVCQVFTYTVHLNDQHQRLHTASGYLTVPKHTRRWRLNQECFWLTTNMTSTFSFKTEPFKVLWLSGSALEFSGLSWPNGRWVTWAREVSACPHIHLADACATQ